MAKRTSYWADRIRASYKLAMVNFLDVAKLCMESAREITKEDGQKELAKKVGISTMLYKRLLKIGSCAQLFEVDANLLPSGYSVLYELAQISDELWPKAIRDGIVSPTVTRREIEKWRKKNQPESPDTSGSVQTTNELETSIAQSEPTFGAGELDHNCVRIKLDLSESGETVVNLLFFDDTSHSIRVEMLDQLKAIIRTRKMVVKFETGELLDAA